MCQLRPQTARVRCAHRPADAELLAWAWLMHLRSKSTGSGVTANDASA
jgi:hypothetical protein